jgi:uncharacterized protein YhbP (UPF0306 family)
MERDGQIASLSDFLALSTMTLATIGAEGQPHAAAVYFAADQALHFHFFSDPHSQHGQHINLNPRAAAAIYPECFDWQDIRGLQMHGKVFQLEDGHKWEDAWQIYQQKFPFAAGMKDIVARNRLYAFIPVWMRLVDNRQGFGFKQEWHLA